MSKKELVIDAVNQLPADATWEQIHEEIEILARIEEGERAADEGRVVPHDEVKRRLRSWISK